MSFNSIIELKVTVLVIKPAVNDVRNVADFFILNDLHLVKVKSFEFSSLRYTKKIK